MATESNKKKSKFGFKNGMSKFKNIGSSVKQNDTVQHFTGTQKQNETSSPKQNNKKNGDKKRRMSFTKNKGIKDRPKLPQLKLEDYTYPTQILTPCESWGEQQYDQEDRAVHDYLKTKYQNEIHKLRFFPSDIIIRFTVSQRGLTPFSERKKETEIHFRAYLNFHAENHYDDILVNERLNCSQSLSSLKTDTNALSLFIYGQDQEGHPVFWDDGSAYSKDAQLDIFKNDMKRVRLFRSRIMRRMHNIKLAASKKYGRMIYKHCMVMDLARFNAKQFVKDRKFHEQNTKDLTDLFPETMHRLYIINAPWAFRSAWKVIQTFLHPITVQKTKILGKDYIDELQKDISLDMIPYKFGGMGPWEIVYGEAPLMYPLLSTDTDFDYSMLPKNELPVPPRGANPDMNKFRAKQQKQMKMSGLKNDNIADIGDLVVVDDADEDDDEKKEQDDMEDALNQPQKIAMEKSKSAPITEEENGAQDQK